MKNQRRNVRRKLMEIANDQGGFFTAHQALMAGYSYRLQHFHCANGNWIREAYGVYRLRDYPSPDRPDLVLLTLWSRNREGKPQAVISHETALSLHELSEIMPSRIHLTIPPGFRKVSPQNCVLHKQRLPEQDAAPHGPYRITTPLRTLLDVAESDLSQEHLNQAVSDALRRGMVREKHLLAANVNSSARKRLAIALETRPAP